MAVPAIALDTQTTLRPPSPVRLRKDSRRSIIQIADRATAGGGGWARTIDRKGISFVL